MKVKSMFDGMSCLQIALNKLGITPERYEAYEIDKHAIKVTQENFPGTIQRGDVTQDQFDSEDDLFLLAGGSPCQGFSFAGKMLNFDDPRSKLFFDYLRARDKLKPKYFLLENVRMKQESEAIITKYLGVEPIRINSALVSAQNRNRLYWTNIPNVKQPEDRGIYLRDIIESGFVDRDKSHCLDANYFKGTSFHNYLLKKRRQIVGEVIQINPSKEAGGKQPHNQNRIYHPDGKAPCLTAEFASRTNVGTFNYSSSGRGNGVVEDRTNDADKAGALTATGYTNRSFTGVLNEDFTFRKLTVLECKRLQTVPDDYKMNVSNSQAYKMLGNGWTVDVIAHILGFAPGIK